MKSIYIHIGPHKTGTTTIQHGIFNNEANLLKDKIYIPKTGRFSNRNSAQHNIAWELIGSTRFDKKYGTWEELVEEIRDTPADKIILSSEEFSRIPQAEILQIKEFLKAYRVFIVVYTRSQVTSLQSIWNQMLKMGEHPNFHDDFYSWLENIDFYYPNYDYYSLIEKWSRVFGKSQILVSVLEKDQLKGTLFEDFLRLCCVEKPEMYENPEDINISPGIKATVLIQELKRRLKHKLDNDDLDRLFQYILAYEKKGIWKDTKMNLIDKEIHAKIMSRYRESNQRVAKEFFGRDQLFLAPFEEKEYTHFSREYFGREELFLEPFQEEELTPFSVEQFDPKEILDAFAFTIEKMILVKNEKYSDNLDLRQDYIKSENQLDAIYASRGWQALEKIRSVRRKIRKLF